MVSDKYSYVGEKIKYERLSHNLTLQELADKTKLSVSFLSQLENGKINPSLKALDKIASFFSIHIANLFVKSQKMQSYHFEDSDHIEVRNNNKILKFLMPKLKEMKAVVLTLEDYNDSIDYTIHQGIEFLYTVEGKIKVDFGIEAENKICKSGDTMIYLAQRTHRILNAHPGISKCFIVNLENTDSINIK